MIGIDLVHIPEFKRNLENGGEAFLVRTFLASELENRNPEHLAGLFAAKEAVTKALALPPGSWLDIEIIGSGSPKALFNNKETTQISISHHGEYAVAVAIKEQ